MREAFNDVYSKTVKLPSLEEAVNFIANNNSYNDKHLQTMKTASADDYQNLFLKSYEDDQLRRLIKWTLQWKGTENEEISLNAIEALERIKATSLLNAIRVNRHI